MVKVCQKSHQQIAISTFIFDFDNSVEGLKEHNIMSSCYHVDNYFSFKNQSSCQSQSKSHHHIAMGL